MTGAVSRSVTVRKGPKGWLPVLDPRDKVPTASEPHKCRCSCDEVSKLLLEIGRLQAERLVLPLDTYRNDDGSIVIDGQRYTPDPEIMVHQG